MNLHSIDMIFDLSIVIPTLNEAENLQLLLPHLRRVADKLKCKYEIIIADAGSKDGTLGIAHQYGATIIIQKKRGYGLALRSAFNQCKGNYIITTDADLSHNPYVIKQLYQERNLAEIVIASRYVRGGFSNTSKIRKILSFILNKIFCLVLDLPLKDLSSGYRLYKRHMLKSLKLEGHNYEILQEIVIQAYIQGYSIKEIPLHYFPRHSGRSHVKFFKFCFAYLKVLLIYWEKRNSIASADYDERAFFSRIPLQKYWQRKRYQIITKLFEQKENVLDIGCGSSKILEAIPQCIGMDIAINKLRFRRDLVNPLLQGDIFSVPFKACSLDEVICSEVIEHVPESKQMFEEFKRILKPGGILILGTPDYSKQLWNVLERIYNVVQPNGHCREHITHYTFQTLKEKLQEHGFCLITHKYILGCELIIKAQKIK